MIYTHHAWLRWACVSVVLLIYGCGDDTSDAAVDEGGVAVMVYAQEVVSFRPGDDAGFGQNGLPDVVLGPPEGAMNDAPAVVGVLSLGIGGEIVLGFGDAVIVDRPGVDLVIFENPFVVLSSMDDIFSEPAEVALSEDGITWVSLPCSSNAPTPGPGPWPGCVGVMPVKAHDTSGRTALTIDDTGGDGVDLAALGLSEVRFVRITDRSSAPATGVGMSAGFDLDAVGVFHYRIER